MLQSNEGHASGLLLCAQLINIDESEGFISCGLGEKGGARMRSVVLTAVVAIAQAIDSGQVLAATSTQIAMKGDAVPGAPAGVTFLDFQAPHVDAAGEVFFHANEIQNFGEGFWMWKNGVLQKVARKGDVTPGRAGTFFNMGD